MKLLSKIVYCIRMIAFLLHFFLLYGMINTLWQIKPLIYVFFLFHFIFVIRIIIELLSKRGVYKEDLIYNFMQLGVYMYIGILYYRVIYSHVYYMKETIVYFNINFGIITFLWLFLLIYSTYELSKRKEKQ